MVKTGDGVLELAAGVTNIYQGDTLVTNGTLLVNGVLDARPSVVTVYAGATLGGTGTINRAVNIMPGGVLAPGDFGVGRLTVSNLTLNAGATCLVDIGSASDRVVVNGDLSMAGLFVVTNTAGYGAGTYDVITYTGVLLTNTATVTNTAPGDLQATLIATDPNKVKIRLSVPPIPGSIFLIR